MKTSPLLLLASAMFLVATSSYAQPVITGQPTNQSSLGAIVSFRVSGTTTNPPLHYQWRFATTNLPAATNASLILTNIQVAQTGAYDALVSDGIGSNASHPAYLEVDPTFTKITAGAIVNDGGASIACAWGDYDNDGFLDLFVTNSGEEKNFLYRNNRNGTFTKITTGRIVNDAQDWRGCAWADYNNDGNLDLVVVNTDTVEAVLYRNNGDGTFTRMPDSLLPSTAYDLIA
ncbi:MAG: FG-GAP repeat domain-containing protein, partial [Limisphaerales bacterium]